MGVKMKRDECVCEREREKERERERERGSRKGGAICDPLIPD